MASGQIDSVNPPGAAANASGSHMASGSIDSVNPPGAAANASRRLGSILLDRQRVYITNGNRSNLTTATAASKGDYVVSVSFWMAEPPGISCFSVYCYMPPPDPTPRDFTALPHVVGADGRFVLLRAQFYSHYGKDEYFMYKAGGYGESPSLEWVPLPDDDNMGTALGRVSEFGVVLGEHRDHYLLAALCDAPDAPADYHLRIYSSETKAWSTRTLLNPCPGVRKIIPDKVIALGEGSLGWVDFSCGLVACDVRQDPPVVRFIPLPEPLPGNRDKVEASLPIPRAAARSFRDLVCFSGVLKFFEMERHMTEEPNDPTDKDVLYDSDLIMSLKRNGVDEKKPKSRDCWRAVTWSRTVCSNFWRKECTLSGDDILVDKTKHSALVSRLRGKACGKLTLSDLYSAFPTLRTDGDDILYLMSVAEPDDRSGWVVAVDLGNRTVKAAVACSFEEHDPSNQVFRPCTLSRYLNMTPVSCYLLESEGTEVSACRKMVRMGSSANNRKNASIHAVRPLPQLLYRPECFPHIEKHPEMKRLRSILAMATERTKRARNEAHSIVQNDHVSEVQPVQTNLTPQQCVNKLDQPLNPVYEQQPSPSNKPLVDFHPLKDLSEWRGNYRRADRNQLERGKNHRHWIRV
ncbi:uncharacterized protein [Miscanthus floridulus]|uniref:uncharacterized protein isoform X3 n=1 Tax=Miscanthus floridulus TaxID=154761 RepID=UPI00345787A6